MVTLKTNFSLQFSCNFSFVLILSFPFFSLFSSSFATLPHPSVFLSVSNWGSVLVGPCHHGMAQPQVADRGTASDKEGSCE